MQDLLVTVPLTFEMASTSSVGDNQLQRIIKDLQGNHTHSVYTVKNHNT